jgi:HEAT repeats
MKKRVNTMKRIPSFVLSVCFLVLGVFAVLLTIMLWNQSVKPQAYLLGVIATAALIWSFVQFSMHSHKHSRKHPHTTLNPSGALIDALQHDPNPYVRSKAVVGLTQLDLEEAFDHQEHKELDNILIDALQHDPNPYVRSKAAVGLAELKLEQEKDAYHHEHNKLDDMLFEKEEMPSS